jgi:hypothetical protein
VSQLQTVVRSWRCSGTPSHLPVSRSLEWTVAVFDGDAVFNDVVIQALVRPGGRGFRIRPSDELRELTVTVAVARFGDECAVESYCRDLTNRKELVHE